MYRCPTCAKAWKLQLTNHHWLLYSPDRACWTLERDPINLTSHVATLHTLEDLAFAMRGRNLDFVRENDPAEDTPAIKCVACKHVHPFIEWHNAWNLPGDYFDGDLLCACGGELWWDREHTFQRYSLTCEKCGWIKPGKGLSGSASTTVT